MVEFRLEMEAGKSRSSLIDGAWRVSFSQRGLQGVRRWYKLEEKRISYFRNKIEGEVMGVFRFIAPWYRKLYRTWEKMFILLYPLKNLRKEGGGITGIY